MSQPTPYVRQANFTDHTQNYPDIPQDGTDMDAEFNAVKTTLDQTLTNIELIQADDGGLANGIVTRRSLSDELLIGVTEPAISWYTATVYAPGDEVWVSGGLYVCNIAHTSGVFATDLAALKWTLILDASPAFIGIITADAQAAQAGAEAAEAAAVAAADSISDLVASVANYWANTAGGTANALVLTPVPTQTAYMPGMKFRFIVQLTNTGAVAADTNNTLGSRTIRKTIGAGTPLVELAPGDLPIGTIAEIEYLSDALGWQLLNVRTYAQGTDVASAATLNLDTVNGDYVAVTGTISITAITLSQGLERTLKFTGVLTLTNGASLILPSGANITTAAGDTCVVRGEAAGVVRVTSYSRASGDGLNADPLVAAQADRVLSGLIMSNNVADATNDIDIAAGSAVSDDGTTIMRLTAITKRLDATWVVDTNQGGLDTGAIANTTYHVWLINRPDTNVTDVLFSTSASAPTMPASYTKKKCIGSIIRASGAILGFVQTGNKFRFKALQNSSAAATQASASRDTRTLTAPVGVVVEAEVSLQFLCPSTTDYGVIVTDLVNEADTAVTLTNATMWIGGNGAYQQGMLVLCSTNTSAQIGIRANTTGGTVNISTRGWTDARVR